MRSGAQIHCSQELVHVPWTSHPSTGKLSTSQNKPEAPQSWPLWPYVSGWCWLNHHQSPPLGSAVPVSSQAMSRMSSFSSQCRDAGRRLTRLGWSSHVAGMIVRPGMIGGVAIECHWFIEINSLTSTGHALPLSLVQVRFRGLCHHHWFHPTEHGCLPCLERCGPPNHAALFSFRTVSIHLQTTTAIDMSWLSHFWAGSPALGKKCALFCAFRVRKLNMSFILLYNLYMNKHVQDIHEYIYIYISVCVCACVCVRVSIFMLLHAWAHDIADCCKQNSSLVENIVLYWIAKVAQSNWMHLLCLLCQEHFFQRRNCMSQAAIRSIFGVCVYMVYIYTHTQSNPYIYTYLHTHIYIYILWMAIHTGSLLSPTSLLQGKRAVFPKQPMGHRQVAADVQMPNQGRHVLQMLPEQGSYGQAKNPPAASPLIWALSHVLLVTWTVWSKWPFGGLTTWQQWKIQSLVLLVHLARLGNSHSQKSLCKINIAKTHRDVKALQGSSSQLAFSHFRRVRLSKRAFRISSSSFNLYFPWRRVSLKELVSMILVRLSASWAPECTHLTCTPSSNRFLIRRAFSCVLNSLRAGTAVLVTKSKRLLQSVAMVPSGSCWDLIVAVEKDSGNSCRACSGRFHGTLLSSNHAQQSRIQESWSSTVLKETVSAANVLVTTLWVFLHPHDIGFTTQVVLLPMSLWVLMIIQPVWESGFFREANDASEKAKNLRSAQAMGLMVNDTLECLLASWRVRLASSRVCIVAWLISDCRKLKRLDKSGRVWTDAYWRLPIKPLSAIFSSEVTLAVSSFRRSIGILMGLIALMHLLWESVLALLGCWNMSQPVKVNWQPFEIQMGTAFPTLEVWTWTFDFPHIDHHLHVPQWYLQGLEFLGIAVWKYMDKRVTVRILTSARLLSGLEPHERSIDQTKGAFG